MAKYITVTETAKLVRAALKTAFPAVKFSVTSKSYSGGAHIRVSWQDGPTTGQVERVTGQYSGSTFDAMIDLKSFHTSTLNGEEAHYGADSISTQREFSRAFLAKIAAEVCAQWGEPVPEIRSYDGTDSNCWIHVTEYKRIGGGVRTIDQLINRAAHNTPENLAPLHYYPVDHKNKILDLTVAYFKYDDAALAREGFTSATEDRLNDFGSGEVETVEQQIVSGQWQDYKIILPGQHEIEDKPEPLYYPVNTSEKILNLQRGYTTAAECLRNHGPAGYDGVTQDTTPTPGYSVFNPPRNRVEVFDRNGLFAGIRDTEPVFIPAAPQPELYRYAMRNRPAGYGTCPDGRIIAEDKPNLYSEATPHYGTVSYTRKLTEKELYKWEMSPDSENAYTWPIGATVEDRESGEVLIVSAHHPRNWYTLYSASHGEKWTVERTGQDIQAVTSPEPPRFDGDYDYTCDHNTYPQDMIIYEPCKFPFFYKQSVYGEHIGVKYQGHIESKIGLYQPGQGYFVMVRFTFPVMLSLIGHFYVDYDGSVTYPDYSSMAAAAGPLNAADEAERIIAAYRRIGHEALWAKGKGGGFWLKSPAVYVSLEQARKDTAALVAVGDALDEKILSEIDTRKIDECIVRNGMFGDDKITRQARRDRDSRNFSIVRAALHDREIYPGVGTLERYYTRRYTEAIPAPVCSLCGRPVDPSGIKDPLCGTCQTRADRYTKRRENRADRLRYKAAKLAGEATAIHQRTHQMAEIMNGQPILVGHHSEKRHRRQFEKMWAMDSRAYHMSQQAERYTHQAAASDDNRAISSDDPAALIKLREKLAILEARQEKMKAVNKLVQKALTKVGMSGKKRNDLRRNMYKDTGRTRPRTNEERNALEQAYLKARAEFNTNCQKAAPVLAALASIPEAEALRLVTPDDLGRVGYPSYALTNNSGNMTRIKQRIADLEKQNARIAASDGEPVKTYFKDGVIVIEDLEDNRLKIVFPGKPSEAMRDRLKANGFRWSPYNTAWQRQLTDYARAAARMILGEPIPPVDLTALDAEGVDMLVKIARKVFPHNQ